MTANLVRDRLVQQYVASERNFNMITAPYHSTAVITFDVVNHNATDSIAFAVASQRNTLDFFSYGVGDVIDFAGNPKMKATEAHTNLAKAKSTNGAADMAIEWVGAQPVGVFLEYDADDVDQFVATPDSIVTKALTGQALFVDPAAIIAPAQVYSPINLKNVLYSLVAPWLSLEFEWDRKRTEKIGTLDQIPAAGGGAYIDANGVPAAENKFRIPEGYQWLRDGQPDSEFTARCRLDMDAACAIQTVTSPIGNAAPVAPIKLHLAIRMRIGGLILSEQSGN